MPNVTFSQHDQNSLFNNGTGESYTSRFLLNWAIIDFAIITIASTSGFRQLKTGRVIQQEIPNLEIESQHLVVINFTWRVHTRTKLFLNIVIIYVRILFYITFLW